MIDISGRRFNCPNCKAGPMTIEEIQTHNEIKTVALRAAAEIMKDMRDGILPATITDFSTLHDFVDANEYGRLCADDVHPLLALTDDDETAYRNCNNVNTMQTMVDGWLSTGLLRDRLEAKGLEVCWECGKITAAGDEEGYVFLDNGAKVPNCSVECAELFYA